RGWRTGYTRKTFHFLIFGSVSGLHAIWGTPAVCLFGLMTSVVVFSAVVHGRGHVMYEAIARENDEPHRTWYIIAPYLATLIGGVLANIWFGPAALAGYLVVGIADAVAEPIGVRFGRHRYRVWTLSRTVSHRSVEGSAAVFVASALAVTGAGALSAEIALGASAIVMVPLIALACAGVESISPHGWDNASMQIVPALLVGAYL
ncbi:MAG: hypothetical protein CMJ49_10310, partial [Planctomycetaceae bacterium]|nr:hypothetical protein [Planctomycetaceae bacterium]